MKRIFITLWHVSAGLMVFILLHDLINFVLNREPLWINW